MAWDFSKIGLPDQPRPPITATNYVLISGTFRCQQCDEDVDEARLFGDMKLIMYKCPVCEHVSKAKNFG